MKDITIEFINLEEENMTVLLLEDENGNETEAEAIFAFKVEETGDEYIIYTDNEILEDGEVEISASKIERTEDGLNLLDMSDEEWAMVQAVIESMEDEEF